MLGQHQPVVAVGDQRFVVPEADQFPVERQHRVRVGALRGDVHLDMGGMHREPGRAGGERCVRRVVPLHRRTSVVPAHLGDLAHHPLRWITQRGSIGRVVVRLDVGDLGQRGERVVRHPEFLALVDVGRAALQMQHESPRLRRPLPELAVVPQRDTTRGWSWLHQ